MRRCLLPSGRPLPISWRQSQRYSQRELVHVRREGTGEETGGEVWDPLGISNAVSDEAMMWFRAAELKHGRAAMVCLASC